MAEITEQIVREAPEIEARKLALMEQAKTLTGTPVTIPGYQAAAMTPDQLQAQELARTGVGSFAPYVQAGSQAITAGQEGILSATGVGQAAQQMFQPGAATQFMNPYQEAVTQQALAEMRRQGDIARQQAASQAVRAGAFGGTREGVQRAELERGLQDIMSQRIAQDYAANFAQAQQAALASGQGLAGIGSLYGNLSGQLGQLGVQQAALGQAMQQGQTQDIQTLATLGQQQQQQAQQELEAQRLTQLQAAYEPYQRLGFLSDIYKGAPTTQSVVASQTAPTTSPFLQAAGLGIAGLSAATGAQKAGLFG